MGPPVQCRRLLASPARRLLLGLRPQAPDCGARRRRNRPRRTAGAARAASRRRSVLRSRCFLHCWFFSLDRALPLRQAEPMCFAHAHVLGDAKAQADQARAQARSPGFAELADEISCPLGLDAQRRTDKLPDGLGRDAHVKGNSASAHASVQVLLHHCGGSRAPPGADIFQRARLVLRYAGIGALGRDPQVPGDSLEGKAGAIARDDDLGRLGCASHRARTQKTGWALLRAGAPAISLPSLAAASSSCVFTLGLRYSRYSSGNLATSGSPTNHRWPAEKPAVKSGSGRDLMPASLIRAAATVRSFSLRFSNRAARAPRSAILVL